MSAAVPKLERALIWDEAGHLAEAAVTALVDGELALLPVDAVQHAEACSDCAERVGRAALFALEVAESLDADLALALAEGAHAPAAPMYALAPAARTALAPAEAAPAALGSRPPYARTPASLAPPPPLPVKAVVAALLVALVAGGPWLWTLRPDSLAEGLAHVARLLTRTIAAVRAPAVPELAWAAAGLLALVGSAVARFAARARGRLVEGT